MSYIVVGIDSSAEAKAALRWSFGFAAALDLPIRAVTAVELPQVVGRAGTLDELISFDERRTEAQHTLHRIVVNAAAERDNAVGTEMKVVTGHAVGCLVEESKNAAAVVVGARGANGVLRTLLGSVSTGLVHHAHCPVVVVRGDCTRPVQRVLVGVDGSLESQEAAMWAARYVQAVDGTLTLLGAWDWPTVSDVPVVVGHFDPRIATQEALDKAAVLTKLPDSQVRTVVAHGSATKAILEAADDADMVVVGSRGLGGFSGMLLGSVSARLVHNAPCPIAVVRS